MSSKQAPNIETDVYTSLNNPVQGNDVNKPSSLLRKVDEIIKEEMKMNSLSLEEVQNEILSQIDASHSEDVKFCASFGQEERGFLAKTRPPVEIPTYERVFSNEESLSKLLAIKTREPLLNAESISIIRAAAETWWNKDDNESSLDLPSENNAKSRFTYQRPGNYEAHLVDLADHVDDRVRKIAKECLRDKIFPLARDAFRSQVSDLNDLDLCVYDSLVIRYNSTEAKAKAMLESDNSSGESSLDENFLGAGQPLHRDSSIISVNIMLNPTSEFEGGGTFFENQLQNNELLNMDPTPTNVCAIPKPLKPNGVGNAIIHLSNERHAGVGTTSGVRDILVIFLTARKRVASLFPVLAQRGKGLDDSAIPLNERAGRLKTSVGQNCSNCGSAEDLILCRILYYRLAIQHAPVDGEAWHYLGSSLYSKAKNEASSQDAIDLMKLSVFCLEYALELIPCDARLLNNLGISVQALFSYTKEEKYRALIDRYYERSIWIHRLTEEIGCDVTSDLDSASLNYGLYVSNQDDFVKASRILERFRKRGQKLDRQVVDGSRLLQFCESFVDSFGSRVSF